MSSYLGKKIVVGLTGGIACYKVVELVSTLTQRGADVQVIMTKAAEEFITPLTLRAISNNQVFTDMFEQVNQWNVKHISLAQDADLLVIAPATANLIGKVATGIADDLLTTTIMATKAPVVIAPAMNVNMYVNPIVQSNINKLTELGYHIVEPEEGYLACGAIGKGRLAPITTILAQLDSILFSVKPLEGTKVLVTAGGTKEPIDPVRFIGNHSSGKMGYAICDELVAKGAQVTLISGPVNIPAPKGVNLINVNTANEMFTACLDVFPQVDAVVKAAAVADYRPMKMAQQKIKKNSEDTLTLQLEKNPDILGHLGSLKQPHQVLIGFAAETEDLLANGEIKLQRKNLDMIVANDITIANSGFNAQHNQVVFIKAGGSVEHLPLMEKSMVAEKLVTELIKILHKE